MEVITTRGMKLSGEGPYALIPLTKVVTEYLRLNVYNVQRFFRR
jgi:hypothetical protein